MIGEDWIAKVKQYRLAVGAYCDAVGRMDSAGDLGQEWQQIEAARAEAERARFALMRQYQAPLFFHTRGLALKDVPDHGTEELVLGDLGQLGG